MGKPGNIELSELITTRISHDLGGSIGAVSSALELLADNDNVLDNETLELLQISSRTLKFRQEFFRIAFGMNTKTPDKDAITALCRNYLSTLGGHTSALHLTLKGVNSSLAKIICLCVMIMAELAIRGGNIIIAIDSKNITLSINSDYKLSAGKIADYELIIAGQTPQGEPSQYAHLLYLCELLGSGVNIATSASETEFRMTIG